MRDRQYWQNGRTADAYRDGIAQLWKLAYPGKNVEGSIWLRGAVVCGGRGRG